MISTIRHFSFTALAVFTLAVSPTPSLAYRQLSDSIIVWGPILEMIDHQPFVRIDASIPIGAELILNGQEPYTKDHNYGYRKILPLPGDLKGKFTYRIVVDDRGEGRLELGPYDARLPGEPGREFLIAAYGDTRGEDSVHYEITERILDSDPDIVLNSGDLVDDGNDWRGWQAFRRFTGDLMARRIYIPSLGNHDKRSVLYFEAFDLPGNEAWFEFYSNPLRLIVLDSNLPPEHQNWQTHWLDETLTKHEPSGSFTVVMFHHPPLGSGRHRPWKYGLQNWVPLIDRSPTDLVLFGHNHLYERIEHQGIPFIISGGGGSSLYHKTAATPETIMLESVYHFVLIRFDGAHLKGEAIRHDGSIIENWSYPVK